MLLPPRVLRRGSGGSMPKDAEGKPKAHPADAPRLAASAGPLPHPPPRPAVPTAARPADPTLLAEQGAASWQKAAFGLLLAGGAGLAVFAPAAAATAGFLALGALIFGFLALRLALAPRFRSRTGSFPLFTPPQEIQTRMAPRITLLLPLYHEGRIAPFLLKALEALDYPRDHLEALILLEADDHETQEAFAALSPPDWIRVLLVPEGSPRTKPRALNWGLAHARGSIVGIFDAEDRPEPDQLRKAAAGFAQAPLEVVCLQARLGWHNARRNSLTRGLALEYAAWFGLLTRGLAARGWPIPLGGTSCYLRTAVLREIGGWDPHNVTEDADLGFKLARRGWRSATLDSTTWEEAVLKPSPWIKQRTRWIKGFLVTWITHMRDPLRLWRELGPAGFVVFNALTIGSFLAYLTLPLHLAALVWLLATGEAPWSGLLPERLGLLLTILFWAGQSAALAMAFAASAQAYGWRFALWTPILPLYLGVLGPIAALRAASQIPRAACVWEKTAHGLDQGFDQGCGAGAPAGLHASRGAV